MQFLDSIKFKDVEVVLINIHDTIDNDIRTIMSKHDFTFLFKGNNVAEHLRVVSYPTMFLYDERKKILYKHIGYGNSEDLIALLHTLSAEK